MKILHVVVLLLIALYSPISTVKASPNIIMVFIDDMGWGDFSCFGNKDVQTPNADRLAKEGIRFSQFYVNSPICSPSRCALVTGQYPYRWKINSFLNNRAETLNLATKHPDRVNNLAKSLLEWNKSMPADNGHIGLNPR